jgi:hypothetical protein
MPYDDITEKYLSLLKEDIADTIKTKGISDTGSAIDSLEVKGNTLLGNDYIFALDKGRKPGKFPPVKNIRDWVRRKLGVKEREVNGVAYVIGRKISEDGTRIYNDPKEGIELDKKVESMLEELYKELPNYAAAEATKYLYKWG